MQFTKEEMQLHFLEYCSESNIEAVKNCIELGVDINQRDVAENTALMTCENLEIISLLINAKANLNAKNKYGLTALMMHEDPAIIKKIIDEVADVNVKDRSGWTALMHALVTGPWAFLDIPDEEDDRHQIVKLLVKAKADINCQLNASRKSALMLVRHLNDAKLLMSSGADIAAIDADFLLAHQQPHFKFTKYIKIRNYLEKTYLAHVSNAVINPEINQSTQPINKRQRI